MSQSESLIQSTTVSMLNLLYPDFVLNLSLNGIDLGALNPQQRAQLIRQAKLEGMEPGVQDLSIYLPESIVLNLEFKTNVGKQSPDQVLIQSKLIKLGHNYHLVRTPYEVFDLIAQYSELTYRVQCMSELAIPSDSTKLTEQFLHFPKGTELAEVYRLLRSLYAI